MQLSKLKEWIPIKEIFSIDIIKQRAFMFNQGKLIKLPWMRRKVVQWQLIAQMNIQSHLEHHWAPSSKHQQKWLLHSCKWPIKLVKRNSFSFITKLAQWHEETCKRVKNELHIVFLTMIYTGREKKLKLTGKNNPPYKSITREIYFLVNIAWKLL
jgi:hypothetical protein